MIIITIVNSSIFIIHNIITPNWQSLPSFEIIFLFFLSIRQRNKKFKAIYLFLLLLLLLFCLLFHPCHVIIYYKPITSYGLYFSK